MPNYTFQKGKKTWTEFMSITERDKFLEENADVTQIPMTATPLLDSVRLGVTKVDEGFSKHVLGRMKSNVHGNNIGNRHFGIPGEV